MFADVNNLPADDPLRNAAAASLARRDGGGECKGTGRSSEEQCGRDAAAAGKVLEAFRADGGTTSTMPDASAGATAKLEPPKVQPEVQAKNGGVVVDAIAADRCARV